MTGDTARLFIGLELNDDARSALSCIRDQLTSVGFRGKLHNPPLYHLTLVFLGNVPAEKITELKAVLDSVSCAPFELTLSSLGTFKGGSILWAGVKTCPPLMEYQARLSRALEAAGYLSGEEEYRPHITLGRQVKDPIPDISVPEISFPAVRATLFHSTRVDDALAYVPIYRSVFR